jgi:hypothetical protein
MSFHSESEALSTRIPIRKVRNKSVDCSTFFHSHSESEAYSNTSKSGKFANSVDCSAFSLGFRSANIRVLGFRSAITRVPKREFHLRIRSESEAAYTKQLRIRKV